jgi:hypothetical protein
MLGGGRGLAQHPRHQILVILFQERVESGQVRLRHCGQKRIGIGAEDEVHLFGATTPGAHPHPLEAGFGALAHATAFAAWHLSGKNQFAILAILSRPFPISLDCLEA